MVWEIHGHFKSVIYEKTPNSLDFWIVYFIISDTNVIPATDIRDEA